MSVATLNVLSHHHNSLTIGASHSYYFYQKLSVQPSTAAPIRQPKQIIPSIPRQHFKAPKNSSLSPIRSQKIMPKNDDTVSIVQPQPKRPYPLMSTFSSPASIQTTKSLIKQRKRKVSFNEKVVVVCTVFDDEEASDTEVPAPRRHSTGEDTYLKSILIHPSAQQSKQQQKFTQSLKQFKKLFAQ